ncbi:MAG: acetyl-CoA carboxylase biotin carboxyl carrier protein [Planctomycetes bacterium]|nr:acetyl-CoA carboxylase biotin carboxyl carrier protein [Planctomycetota bacterium]
MAAKKARKKPTKKSGTRKTTKKASAAKVRKPAAKKRSAKKATKSSVARKADGRGSRSADRVDQIQRLIDVMVAAGAVEVEMEEVGSRLRVRLKEDTPHVVSYAAAAPHPAVAHHAAPLPAPTPVTAEPAEAEETGEVFTSPMVGTFYASPSPDAEPFVRVGDRITEDTTLCILEAMKVMNEIKSEISGSIVKVLVQNGQPVEFGQPLFVIEAD